MNDMTMDYWSEDDRAVMEEDAARAASAAMRLRLSSREQPAFFAPDKCGDVKENPARPERCGVRARRADWAIGLQRRYGARVVEWIDTGIETEKQAAVLLLRHSCPGGQPVLVICWRGSKSARDYGVTDASPTFAPLRWPRPPAAGLVVPDSWGSADDRSGGPATDDRGRGHEPPDDLPYNGCCGAAAGDSASVAVDLTDDDSLRGGGGGADGESGGGDGYRAGYSIDADVDTHSVKLMPLLAGSPLPCVTSGLWRAYAGASVRCTSGMGPRARVRVAVERALRELPNCRVCVAGHSLGGALATLCAVDLLHTCPALAERTASPNGITLIALASPRFFNSAFQAHASSLAARGALHPINIVVHGDLIPHLPPRSLGGYHGTSPRLTLHPPTGLTYVADGDDQTTAQPNAQASAQAYAHADASASAQTSAQTNAQANATRPSGSRAEAPSDDAPPADFAPADWSVDSEEQQPRTPSSSPSRRRSPSLLRSPNLSAVLSPPPVDVHAHTSHALFLSGETTPMRPQTLPAEQVWPLIYE